jgi:hypothetical protein
VVVEGGVHPRDAQIVSDVDAEQHEVGLERERLLLEHDQVVVDVAREDSEVVHLGARAALGEQRFDARDHALRRGTGATKNESPIAAIRVMSGRFARSNSSSL